MFNQILIRTVHLLIALYLAGFAAVAHAEVYRCPQLSGTTNHQQRPCDISSPSKITRQHSKRGVSDFNSDRCYVTHPFGKIRRLYIGRMESKQCVGSTDGCKRLLGNPDKTVARSEREKSLVFYGRKRLYRGTGSANKSIGPEWRELRVVNGKVVEDFSAVQIMEAGYSWFSDERKRPEGENYTCESYGKCNASSCSGVTPIGAIPPLRERPKLAKRYSNEELSSLYLQFVMLRTCDSLSDEYKRIGADLMATMRKNEPNLLLMFERSPEYPIDLEDVSAEFLKSSTRESQEAFCNDLQSGTRKTIDGGAARP